jgi:hypothetical protein
LCRGSSSKKHWKDNLNYAKLEMEFGSLGLLELDKIDDLDTPAENGGGSAQTMMARLAAITNFATGRGTFGS